MNFSRFGLWAILIACLIGFTPASVLALKGDDGGAPNIPPGFPQPPVGTGTILVNGGSPVSLTGVAGFPVQVLNHTFATFDSAAVVDLSNVVAAGSAVSVFDTSRINCNGATFGLGIVTGGFATNALVGLTAFDQSLVTVSGGTLHSFISSGGSSTDVAIGLSARGTSSITVNDGNVTGSISSGSGGTATAYGLFASDHSSVSILNGNFIGSTSFGVGDGLRAFGQATVSILGGSFDGEGASTGVPAAISAGGSSTISIFGGSFSSANSPGPAYGLMAQDTAQILLYGSGFNYPFGAIPDLTGTITGILQNGQNVNLSFQQGHAGQISLVPEPSTIGLAVLVSLIPFRSRRR
ncbi:MAG TPA: hypothetical protein VH518_08335 [Tepidisphaeraceae bacterium]|jgi:hypothetical protein